MVDAERSGLVKTLCRLAVMLEQIATVATKIPLVQCAEITHLQDTELLSSTSCPCSEGGEPLRQIYTQHLRQCGDLITAHMQAEAEIRGANEQHQD